MSSRRLCLEDRALRDDPLRRVAPERHEELAGERGDHDPAQPALGVADAGAEPPAEGRVRLITQPHPGGFDHDPAQPRIAGLGDALVAIYAAALPRRGREPAVGSDLAAVGKVAEERFERQHRGEFGTDGPQALQRYTAVTRRDGNIAFLLDLGELRCDDLETLDLAHDLGLGARRSRRIGS